MVALAEGREIHGAWNLEALIGIMWRYRRSVIVVTAAGCLLTYVLTFLITVQYRAETTILPAERIADRSELGSLGALKGAAASLGLGFGQPGDNIAILLPSILRSRDLLERLLERQLTSAAGEERTFIQELAPRGSDERTRLGNAIDKLQKNILRTDTNARTGVTTIAIKLPDPALAAAVANACVEELDRFSQAVRNRQTVKEEDFIRARLADVRQQLGDAEETLKSFREKNRSITGSPQLQMEEDRLSRAVELQERLFYELSAQHELTKIEAVKNLPLLVVLERAQAPIRPDSPRRGRFLLSAFIVFGTLAVLAALVRDHRRRPDSSPEHRP
jgi:uncharacterized protein involved in exopolysaccharide biosynthesis